MLSLFFFIDAYGADKFKVKPLIGEQLVATTNAINQELQNTTLQDVSYTEGQSFTITFSNGSSLAMLSGKGKYNNPEGIFVDTCFVGFAPASGSAYLIFTVGIGNWEATSCNDLLAIGFIADEAMEHPKILLLYSAQSPNYESKPAALLSWNKKASHYEVDEKTSALLDNIPERTMSALKKGFRAD